jgi:hypothetical protein
MIQNMVDQLADGGRNILHMCAALCTPTSNKQQSEDITTNSLGAALDAYSSRSRPEDVDRRGYVMERFA